MLESKTRWKLNNHIDSNVVEKLISELQIDPLIARLLAVRGMQSSEEAARFLHCDDSNFYDPMQLHGMEAAVNRIIKAGEQQEKIRIYGDYDADGVTSTALMVMLMSELGIDCDYYIPHRANEGYGLNKLAIDHAKSHGVDLIITVDNGISAMDEISYANELGINVIVTDHHEPPEVLPDAYAIINPKQPKCTYPFKQLAGVGVAFKLAHALLQEIPRELLQLAAVGTIADLMPLTDENRLIVKLGLEQLHHKPILGLKALASASDIEYKEVTAMHVGFSLAPRINASGRLDSAMEAVQLLIASSEQLAEDLALQLDQMNKERQRIVDEIVTEAMQELETSIAESPLDSVIVIARENWNVGVIGIVASKILEKYYRPVIVLSKDPETGLAKGSARSIPGFDMYQALTECKHHLMHYGGHQAAAGMTLHQDQIAAFREHLNRLAEEWLTADDFIPITHIDMECSIQELPLEMIERIQALAPFGMGNPSPRFIFNELRIHDMKAIGKEQQHLKLMASQTMDEISYTIEAIGFGHGEQMKYVSPTSKVDLLGEISINEWNGIRKPQVIIQDIRIQERQVFDWRGGRRGEQLLALNKPALIVKEGVDLNAMTIDLSDASLWALHHEGEVAPLNEWARAVPLSQATDLVLYSLPDCVESLSLLLKQCTSVQRIYAVFYQEKDNDSTIPTRDSFKKAYATLLHQQQWDQQDQRVLQYISKQTGLSTNMVGFVIDVFEELSFIEKVNGTYTCISSPQKRELDSSVLYQMRQNQSNVEQVFIYTTTQELTKWILKHCSDQNIDKAGANR